MLTGLPSASNGVRFLLNFFPPVDILSMELRHELVVNQVIPPLVGLLNFPPRPLPPGGILAGLARGW